MKIVYASDETFAPVAAASILSLLESNRGAERLDIFVLDDGMTETSRARLAEIAGRCGRSLRFVPFSYIKEALPAETVTERGTRLTTFARLFLPSIFPDMERILYLDADTLIADSLMPLWEAGLGEKAAIGGVPDCIGKKHKENIGLAAGDPYINAGVILFDLCKMRECGAEAGFTEYLKRYGGKKIPFTDQGVINAVLKGRIQTMPLRYNAVTLMYAASYEDMVAIKRADAYVRKPEWEEARKNPAIVHFTTCFLMRRPWEGRCAHPFAGIWRSYCGRTPWGELSAPDGRSGAMKAYTSVYRLLPHGLAAKATGFVHGSLKAGIDRQTAEAVRR